MKVYLRVIHARPRCVRVRLPANHDNTELLNFIERELSESGKLDRIRGNAVTGSLVLEFTGSFDNVLAKLSAHMPPGVELRAECKRA